MYNTAEPQFIVKTTPSELAITLSDNILFGRKKKEVNILQWLLVYICYIFSRYSFMETMLSSRQCHALLRPS